MKPNDLARPPLVLTTCSGSTQWVSVLEVFAVAPCVLSDQLLTIRLTRRLRGLRGPRLRVEGRDGC